MAESARRSGDVRRRNGPETKARILAAAQQQFGTRGYGATGMRDIAEVAGVAVSLLPLHFGSKAALFESALRDAASSARIFSQPRPTLGRSLVDYMIDSDDLLLPSMVVLSIGDPEAHEIAMRVVRERGIDDMARLLGAPCAEARALEFLMLATGFVLYARRLPLAPVSQRTRDKFAGLLQAILDE